MNTDALFYNGNLVVPGLVGDVTKYFVTSTPYYAPNLSLGAAIALVGAITRAGWVLPSIPLVPDRVYLEKFGCTFKELDTPEYPVTESVILVAKGAVGEEENIDLVDSLLDEIDCALASDIRETQLAILNNVISHIGYAGFEHDRGNLPGPNAALPRRHKKRLLDNEMSLLARTRFEDFSRELPYWYELSPFFGECLLVPYYGQRLRRKESINQETEGRKMVVERLLRLARFASSLTDDPMEVDITDGAKGLYKEIWRASLGTVKDYEGIRGLGPNTPFQALRVAGIMAVGVNPTYPVIDDRLLGVGARLAMESVNLARSALGPVPLVTEPETV